MTAANQHQLDGDQPSFFRFIILLLPKLILVAAQGLVSLLLWPLYWVGKMIWGHPPNVPYSTQVRRYLKQTWTVSPENPALPGFARLWITLSIIQKVILIPVPGLAWFLDELLYGSVLNSVSIKEPLFVISAARSGSTQITRYLEDDPRLAAPNILQTMFPYLWLWKLVPKTLGRLLSKDRVRDLFQRVMPPELWERHESDPFRADTFDGSFYSFHLNRFSLSLGPEIARQDFNFAFIAPHDQHLKEVEFIKLGGSAGPQDAAALWSRSRWNDQTILDQRPFPVCGSSTGKKVSRCLFSDRHPRAFIAVTKRDQLPACESAGSRSGPHSLVLAEGHIGLYRSILLRS